MIIVRNPYSDATLAQLPWATHADASATLNRARAAFERWQSAPAWERSQLLMRVAEGLEHEREQVAQLIASEAGKPIRYARVEVERGLGVLRYAAAEAQRYGGELLRLDTTASGRAGFGIHTRFPRGVVLGITPFNFPLNLALHKIAPAVACGCSIVIKPSPATPLTALKIAELFEKAQAPAGLVQVLLADDTLTAELTRAPEIAMLSFTGSARVGHIIRAQAPLKPCALELGGNAWVIVAEDTPSDLVPLIARKIAGAAFGYAGQSCISVQNVAVASSRWEEVQAALAQATRDTAYGDTLDETVISGPVINDAAVARVRAQLEAAPGDRVTAATSSARGSGGARVMAPTLVALDGSAAALDSPIVQEEIFGPVMTASRFEKIDALIGRINSSRYGLQAGVFTQSLATIERLYRELQVGGVVVNDAPTTRYDHQPYGGIKDSGEGREGIRYAMDEMTTSKFLALSSTVSK